ncbi:unnamed protein product [Sphagnum troendelagicum]|uniref:Uncharacterized protein n=1 Tax=Sphagnum troendelagicum TaxID=128251 RepID=A0ABP0TMD8_9BRYO
MVNLRQNVSSEALERDVAVTLESASSETLEVDLEKMSLCDPVVTGQTNAPVSDSDTNADDDSDGEVPALLQIHQVSGSDAHFNHREQLALSDDKKMSTRWKEISQKIGIDHNLEEEKK